MAQFAPSIRQIYQIGDVVLHAHSQFMDVNLKARGSSLTLQDTNRVLISTSNRKHELREESVNLTLYNAGKYSEGQLVQKLSNLLGVYTDIIAYEMVNTNPTAHVHCSCAICGCCSCEMLWFHNAGRITEISVNSQDNITYEASISFEFQGYWKTLNRIIWHKDREMIPIIFKDSTPEILKTAIVPYPTCQDIFDCKCFGFHKHNYTDLDWLLEPETWFYPHCYHRPYYPDTAVWTYWESGNNVKHLYFIDPKWWSAPPLSIYSIKDFCGLDTTAEIVINTMNGNRPLEYEITINFDTINQKYTDLGYTCEDDDRIIFGEVEGFAYIKRNGVPLFYVADAFTRTAMDFYGQIYPGHNHIQMITRGSSIAMIHVYRRL